jgi:hypothetical protein
MGMMMIKRFLSGSKIHYKRVMPLGVTLLAVLLDFVFYRVAGALHFLLFLTIALNRFVWLSLVGFLKHFGLLCRDRLEYMTLSIRSR